ncbi:MAG: hypothetical protein V7782_09760 [Psychromonas sp.]
MILRRVMVFLVCILLAAHFLRYGNTLLVAVFALLPLLSLTTNKYAIYLLQTCLFFSAFGIWLPTMVYLTQYRMAMAEPWLQMVLILTVVMVFTAITAWYAKDLKETNSVE